MQNTRTNITATTINKQTGQRWFLSEDRRLKVRHDDSNTALIIEDGTDLYRVMDGRVFDLRSKRDITEGFHATEYLLPLVENSRRAQAMIEGHAVAN